MQTYDLSLIQQDLKIMEQRLNEYGANPIQAETSLNTLFKNFSKSSADGLISFSINKSNKKLKITIVLKC